jgi:hypothetical protein
MEADLGAKVELDNWGRVNLGSFGLLSELRDNQRLRDAIGEAGIVTLVIGANDLLSPLSSLLKREDCGGEDIRDCLRDEIESFEANYDAILAELLTLCSSKTIIRTMTYAPGSLEDWDFDGDPVALFEPLNDHIIQASSENNIPVALVHVAFHGPDGDQDPMDKGYLAADGLAPNEMGAAVIADAHRELGYEFTCP